jgi:tRNA (guanine-N7-)-methyltransferase
MPASVSTLICQPPSYVERLKLADLFPLAQPLEVELGSGDGGFLAQYAAAHADRNFLGVERLLGRLRKLDRKGQRAGLTNLRLIRLEASYLVAYLLPPETVSALHIYFPDPWPKRRHHKHRLINERFTELVAGVLTPGGAVYLRTDDSDYYRQMTRVFAGNANFQAAETPAALERMPTDFEKDFIARGAVIHRAAYQRC